MGASFIRQRTVDDRVVVSYTPWVHGSDRGICWFSTFAGAQIALVPQVSPSPSRLPGLNLSQSQSRCYFALQGTEHTDDATAAVADSKPIPARAFSSLTDVDGYIAASNYRNILRTTRIMQPTFFLGTQRPMDPSPGSVQYFPLFLMRRHVLYLDGLVDALQETIAATPGQAPTQHARVDALHSPHACNNYIIVSKIIFRRIDYAINPRACNTTTCTHARSVPGCDDVKLEQCLAHSEAWDACRNAFLATREGGAINRALLDEVRD